VKTKTQVLPSRSNSQLNKDSGATVSKITFDQINLKAKITHSPINRNHTFAQEELEGRHVAPSPAIVQQCLGLV
jgi:hypothetical protein